MDEYDRAYQRVKEQLVSAHAEATDFRGACKDCLHYKFKVDQGYQVIGKNYCMNPLIADHQFSVREGKVISIGHAHPESYRPKLCGRAGLLFEPAVLSSGGFLPVFLAVGLISALGFIFWLFWP